MNDDILDRGFWGIRCFLLLCLIAISFVTLWLWRR